MIVGRKIDLDRLLLAGRGAREAALEIGEHLALAEHEADVLALAAGERRIVDRAVEIDDDAVAGRRGAQGGRVFGLLLAQTLDHRVDVVLGDRRDAALDFERLGRFQLDLRVDLEGRDIRQVLALVEALRLDPRTARGRELLLRDRFGEARLQQLADHFLAHLRPELALDHGERRLARPEALQARGAAQILQPRGDLLRDTLGRHLHLHAARELAGALDGNLHFKPLRMVGS